MAERIYTRGAQGELVSLTEERFQTEDALQELLAEHPELLDGEQMRPGDPRRWILITREQGIADTPHASPRWSLDHLILDQDAVPTLVEVKRGANSEIRRQVVGQMLDYATNASRTWTADELRKTFEEAISERGGDPGEELARLLDADEPDADSYWDDVATNLAAKRLRLLFVADAIPDELARIVEFLNEQMPNIEVLAVEIKQFRGGESAQTLVPRVIGRVAGASARAGSGGASGLRRKLNREEFMEELGDNAARDTATRLFDVAQECGARIEGKASSISIRAPMRGRTQPLTVAWLFLPGRSGPVPRGGRDITFRTDVPFWPDEPEVRTLLKRWGEHIKEGPFTAEALLTMEGEQEAWAVTYADAGRHLDLLAGWLQGVLAEMKAQESG